MAPSERPAPSLVALSARLVGRCRPYAGRSLLGLLGIAVVVAFGAYFPLTIKALIDNASGPRDQAAFLRDALGLLLAFAVYLGAAVLRDRMVAEVTVRTLNDLRAEIYERLQRLSLDVLSRRQVGDLTAYFSNDALALEHALRVALPAAILGGLQAVVSLVVLFLLDWRLALAGLAILGSVILGPKLVSGRAALASTARRGSEARLSGMAAENIGGQLVIRALGLQSRFQLLFQTLMAELQLVSVRANFLASLTGTFTQGGVVLAEILVIALGAWLVLRGQLGIGSLIGFVGILMNVGTSLSELATAAPEWIQASGSMRRVDDLLTQPGHEAERQRALSAGPLSRDIRFHDVSFGYGSEHGGVHSLDLRIGAGAFVGIVGSSGSGKSTILKLLLRVYEPAQGSIEFDGRDLQLLSEASLRSQTSVVLQDSFLFDTTIGENIRLGRPDATDAEVEQAACAAQVHDAIAQLPRGYATEVGERGDRLSGGQRQRVSLARAILREPALLLLDEATSALDPATEAAFNQTLQALSQGRTVVSVTHRLATVVDADHIVVLDGGRIVEQGRHAELLARRGLYFSLWQKQAGFDISADGHEAQIETGRLAAVPLFEGIEPSLLASVAGLFFTEQFTAGAAVFSQGDVGDKFYIVVRGTLEVTTRDADGVTSLVDVLQDGDFFGDIDLIRGQPRAATVRARTDSVVLALSGQHFRRLVDAAPVLRAIFEQVAEVRGQQRSMREAALKGVVGWSDTA